MKVEKYYALYSDKKQSKLLTCASSIELMKSETEYYTNGIWFEYDKNEGSSLIFNEKEMKDIEFPKEAKKRNYTDPSDSNKPRFKWVS